MSDYPELPFDWPQEWTVPVYERRDALYLMRERACRIATDEHRACCLAKRQPSRDRQIEALAIWRAANFLATFFRDGNDR